MDPATIYAITVTLVGVGYAPELKIERLPPQWTMADCIRDHEKKLADQPRTKALCVSRDRFKRLFPRPQVYLVSIRSDGSRAVDLTKWHGTITECRNLVARFRERVTAFCVETIKIDKRRISRHG